MHNLRLLQTADMFSGQFRSLDMTTVDLESEFQSVPSPDKSLVDSPPTKAAPRYRQQNFLRKFLLILFFISTFSNLTVGQIDTTKYKRHFSYGVEVGGSLSIYKTYDNSDNSVFYFLNCFTRDASKGFLVGGIIDFKPAKPFFDLETGLLLQQKVDWIYFLIVPTNIKIYFSRQKPTNFFIKFGIYNAIGLAIKKPDKFGSDLEKGDISRYDIGINYGCGFRFSSATNRKIELWLRSSLGSGIKADNEPFASGTPYYRYSGIKTIEIGLNYQIQKN
jgi:hypothetical protein